MVIRLIVSGIGELVREAVGNLGTRCAIAKYTFKLPVDLTRPFSPACFETCAKDYETGRLSYEEFLDATLAHLDPKSPSRHPEDSDLANLAKLSTYGPMGPVAAAIKLCMLCDKGRRIFPQEAIDMLRLMNPSAASTQLRSAAPLSDLPPLYLQIVIIAALQRELPTLAIEILSSNPPPAPPKKSLFNLLDSAVCPVAHLSQNVFNQFPIDFWMAAVKARWVAPSPSLGRIAAGEGLPGAPLLRVLLDTGMDVTSYTDGLPLYQLLLIDVAEKHDDLSLMRDILARVRCRRLDPALLRHVVSQRDQGGVEMLAMLLDRGLDINYRDKTRVFIGVQLDPASDGSWYEVSMTALHKAAQQGNRDAVSFLVSRGADVNEPDYMGRTARRLALGRRRHEIVQWLDENAPERRGPICPYPDTWLERVSWYFSNLLE
ncbi:hypothetical protein F5Y10DRAFT_259523 [Nemania abortiva]|nr:hypothetical protein F5Y10DRAFT_259523 [Nemania abortiva]